jgi:hypothetical protein
VLNFYLRQKDLAPSVAKTKTVTIVHKIADLLMKILQNCKSKIFEMLT